VRVSHHDWSGDAFVNSRRRVNFSTVGRLLYVINGLMEINRIVLSCFSQLSRIDKQNSLQQSKFENRRRWEEQ